ncbi:hypothetical protein NQ314_016912 [Rhamnusium bicolor]|uniref:Uncharacterized protein n=1 Tax=Rhamnusium bicolor TaxID=1586634 RepID=A0AAV8WUI6_9CUCU|nr:hypothetical protein NQ314_016912 [Rhamnusium bicolor]
MKATMFTQSLNDKSEEPKKQGHFILQSNTFHSLDVPKNLVPLLKSPIYHDDIYDFKSLIADIGWNSTPKKDDEDKLKITQVKVFKVDKKNFGKIFYKTRYEQDEFQQIDVLNRQGRRKNTTIITNFGNIVLKKAYKKRVGITEKKKKSLLSLFKKKTIPMAYFPFYNAL